MRKRFTLILAFLSLLAINAMAVPASPYPIDVTQSDGSVLTIRLHGDEFFSYATTTDGYLLKRTQQGNYEYARFVNDEIVSTGVLARNHRTDVELALISTLDNKAPVPQERIEFFRNSSPLKSSGQPQRAPGWTGKKRGLVILVNFKDKSFSNLSTANDRFTNLLNEPGYSQNGGTGSAKEYFEVSSANKFSPQFDVYGPFTLSQNMAYYGAPNGSQHDSRPGDMVIEACRLAIIEGGADLSVYDTNGSGVIDNVFIYYAGNNEAEGGGPNTIWPHRSRVYTSEPFSGKRISDYACTSEFRGTGSVMCGIGTFCHEFGHVIGLPDFYNTSNSYQYDGIGHWSIMSSGAYNNGGCTPPAYLAWEKFYLGYLTPEVLDAEGEYLLEPIVTHNKAYIISKDDIHNLIGQSPNPREFFMVENHQNIEWDEYSKNTPGGVLGHGLLITRVNFISGAYSSNSVNNNPNALGFEVMGANGKGSYVGNTYPGTTNKTIFEPKFLDGSVYSDGTLLNIEEMGEDVFFCYRVCGATKPSINILPETTKFKTVAGTPSAISKMRVIGSKLENDIKLTFANNTNNFQMKLSENSNWVNSITLTPSPVDSTIDIFIDVRYNPAQPSYKTVHKEVIQAKTTVGNTPIKRVELTGKSTRKIWVVPPIMQETTKLSPYSFQANWKKVFDAVGYYVTVYTKDGKTTETENFTDFNIIAKSGWNQTFYTTTNVSVPSAPCAVLFTNPEDTLYSSYYPEAVTEIKFWVRSEDKQRESQFFIEGLTKDNVWDTVATLPITLGLTGNTKTYSLDAEKGFRRFRFSVDEMISKKGLVFDDFSATHNAKVIMNRYLVESPYIVNGLDSLRVMSLVPNTEYICKVQATDQDDQVRYENVTDYSVVEVTTIDGTDADSRKLSVSIGSDGSILVSINDADLKDSKGNPLDLYVFSVTGQLVRHFPYSSFKENPGQIVISGLLINNTYIISLGAKRKSKFAKVFVK